MANDQLSNGERVVARNALWSVATRANQLESNALPAILRPMNPHEALEAITSFEDREAANRRRATIWTAIGAAPVPALLADVNLEADGPLRNPLVLDPAALTAALAALLGASSAVNQLVQKVAGESLSEGAICSYRVLGDPAQSVYRGTDRDTTTRSQYVTRFDLDELRTLLDPRRWANCGELFLDTYRTRTTSRREPYAPLCPDPDDHGHSWSGYLYESTDTGVAGNRIVLRIEYTVHDAPNPAAGAPRTQEIIVKFQLADSIATSLGPFEMTGLLQQDAGILRAQPLADGGLFKSRIYCEKTIKCGRLSTWSGGSGWDFGEIFNYLLPAILTLWTVHVQSIVPCCRHKP